MNNELVSEMYNLTHSELVSELYHVMQEPVLEQYPSSEYETRLRVLWDYLENSSTESLEVLYTVYY
jgi:hypothetical protein